MTFRERKKEKIRERLAAEALRLFEERGYQDTTIEEIAAAAEVSRRTFFRYFPTKEAVLFPDRERRLEAFRAHLDPSAAGGDPLQAVRRALLSLAKDYEAHREGMVTRQRIVESSPALLALELSEDRPWEDALAAALGDRSRAPAATRLRARILAGALMGAIRVTLREWCWRKGRVNLETLGEEALVLLAAGMRENEKGEIA